ncbi:hypothetical protein HHK36_006517 [Tetracentron sinense]|uniref:Peptidase C1A propeptide domain-containing protein n=1 Tax=Tetracentron sinense TaxID=13715 RepID=A0A835DKZ5_TETSI|nr:hypothetical protein HHK36_006517 [Tetracentron sinense]
METSPLYFVTLLLLGAISAFLPQVFAVKPIPPLRSQSEILQVSIVEQINANPKAGWEAAMNPRFSNFTIGQFKYLLGVKPASQNDLEDIPVITHPKSLDLPKQFDARTAWPQCGTIGKILGQLSAVSLSNFQFFQIRC